MQSKVIRRKLAASRKKIFIPEPVSEVEVAESKLRDRYVSKIKQRAN